MRRREPRALPYRYVTLAMLALAWLAVTRASLADDSDDLVTSANEIRRMFTALCGPPRDEHAPGTGHDGATDCLTSQLTAGLLRTLVAAFWALPEQGRSE